MQLDSTWGRTPSGLMKVPQSRKAPPCLWPAGCTLSPVPFRKRMLSRPQKNFRGTLSQNHTYLESKERLAVIEAAQSCREGVQSIAFLRHLSSSVPGPHTFFRVQRKGFRASAPGAPGSCAAPTADRQPRGQGSEPAPSARPGWDFSPPLKPTRSTRSILVGWCPACHAHRARNSHVTRLAF